MKKISILSALLLNVLFAFSQITYQYDNLNRLYQVNYPNGTSVVYTFDELGNRLSKTVGSDIIAVTGVSLNKNTTSLSVGSTEQLTATVAPANATNRNVNWSSNKPAVATVSASGLIAAQAEGTAVITAATVEGGFTATCNVEVLKQNTDIPNLFTETFAYLSKSVLYVNSPVAETVQVYSISGVALYKIEKPAGTASYPVNQTKGVVLIVKGSSGWVRKAIAK